MIPVVSLISLNLISGAQASVILCSEPAADSEAEMTWYDPGYNFETTELDSLPRILGLGMAVLGDLYASYSLEFAMEQGEFVSDEIAPISVELEPLKKEKIPLSMVSVPEPSFLLLGASAGLLGLILRRRSV